MKFVIICGPQAVGKMTVGQELAKTTELRLFHNHMTIDVVANFFNYRTPEYNRLVKLFRKEIFKAVVKSDLEGIIFTFLWAFNKKKDWNTIRNYKKIFDDHNAETYIVELECDFDERLTRNEHPHRLEYKPSKRDVSSSKQNLIDDTKQYRLNSDKGEMSEFKNYIRINNTNLSPEQTVSKICKAFGICKKDISKRGEE